MATSSSQSSSTAPVATSTAPEPTRRWRLPAGLRALRHYNYRLFFLGQLISLIGTWMQSVAQGWLVLRLTDSPLLLGLVAAANSLPVLLLSLPAGALLDRVSKHRVLLITQVGALLLALILGLLTITGLVQIWHVLLLATLLGVVNAFDAPARQSFTIEMVGREDLLNAIALNASIFNGARTIGPAVAGLVVGFIGEGPAFLLNALSFVAVIISLLLMRLPPFTPPASNKQGGGLREGLRYITQQAQVRSLLLLAGAVSLFGFSYIPLMPIFARDVFGVGATGLGLLAAAGGLGSLAAAVLLAVFGDRVPRGRLLLTAVLLYPLLVIGFTLVPTFLPAMLLLTLMGWAGVTSMALTNTLIQSIVPNELRGRVMSVFTLLLMGLSPMGGMVAGAITELVGSVQLVVAASAALCWLLAAVTIATAPHLRRL
ncbi:MAG: MFS transporter [Chloroflexaceae bacterium]|jgi:MFS family permease|nr:MFS transporter [Chloroflexaceae bacterium]